MPRRRANEEMLERGRRLSAELVRLRRNAGLSQEDLSRRSGVGIDAIRRIEQRAVHDPGFFTVADLANVTGATLDAIARGIGVGAGRTRSRNADE